MIPCLVTSLVFLVFTLILSVVTIANILANGRSIYVRGAHVANLAVYLYVYLFSWIYRVKYSKKDLLRTEEEEIDVWERSICWDEIRLE